MSGWNAVTWDTARAGGLISYLLLTASVSLGLILRNRWQSSRWPRLVTNELPRLRLAARRSSSSSFTSLR